MAAMTLEEAGALPPPDAHFRVVCLESGLTAEHDDPAALHGLLACPPETCCQGGGHDCYADDTPVCHPLVIHARVVMTGSGT